jgi:hypothetical protein
MKKKIGLAMLAMAMLTVPGWAAEEGWSFKLTPYLWTLGVDGDVGIGPVSAPVDVKFTDAVKDLEFGGMLSAEADYGPWSILGDVEYLGLETDKDTHIGEFEVELEQWLLQGAALYSFVENGKTTLDLGLGGRYMSLDVDLNAPSDRPDLSQSKGWADPILVARVSQQFTEKFFGVLYGDIGGFGVSSDSTWQVMATAGYAINDTVSMLFGYRYLDYDYEKDAFSFDAAESGLVLGVQFGL